MALVETQIVVQSSLSLLRRRLESLGRETMRRADVKTLELAEEIAEAARRRAPTDTGTLRGSILVRDLVGPKARIRVDADYGALVEFGTQKTVPRPFVGPALQDVGLLTVSDLEREFESIIPL
jgi:HK97 gp10 family phage protein